MTSTAITFSDSLDPNTVLTFDATPDADVLDLIGMVGATDWLDQLIPVPYTHPAMVDVERFAVVSIDDRGDLHVLGRIVAIGGGRFEAFSSGVDSAPWFHSFGTFESAAIAAAYVGYSVEW